MRSKLMTVASVAASVMLGASVAAADPVQEQLRLMEQRMAEMEDRLQATSDKLKSAEATVEKQQSALSEAGLADDEKGARSAVGTFFQMIDVSGLAAASYNHRFLSGSDGNPFIGNSFRHQNANSFSLDQLWLTLDKPVNEESRAGFHADLLYGASAQALRNSIVGSPLGGAGTPGVGPSGANDFFLASAYVSYLAPIGNGIRFDAGKRGTLMGIERIKTSVNFNVTQGRVFQLIPIVNTGVLAETNLTDEISIAAGAFNDVYADTSFDDSRQKAYFSQIKYTGEMFTFKVDSMIGKNSASGLFSDNAAVCTSGQVCNTSVFEALATAQLAENLETWLQYVWSRNFGNGILSKGDTHAIAGAARYHLTDDTSVATRVEYLRADTNFNNALLGFAGSPGMGEVVTATFTGAQKLTNDLTLRAELRYDRNLTKNVGPLADSSSLSTRNNQLLAIAELYYEF